MNRWRGLVVLVKEAVESGSIAIEKIQKETAQRPFGVLEQIPPIAGPVKVIHTLHDVSVSTTHTAIRLVNRVVGEAVDAALASAERE
ncbi:MAG: uncharacterized protein H6Q89_687 [Myxococcaceae bacterium]|nr:uncharacterized protein [Myxococcaceae bacterium]